MYRRPYYQSVYMQRILGKSNESFRFLSSFCVSSNMFTLPINIDLASLSFVIPSSDSIIEPLSGRSNKKIWLGD